MLFKRKFYKFSDDLAITVDVEDYSDYYNVGFRVNDVIMPTQLIMKPKPPLTFGDLKPGAKFLLIDPGNKERMHNSSVYVKLQDPTYNGFTAIWLEDNRDYNKDSSGGFCVLKDDDLVEEIVDL
jgi:hypothetical protein